MSAAQHHTWPRPCPDLAEAVRQVDREQGTRGQCSQRTDQGDEAIEGKEGKGLMQRRQDKHLTPTLASHNATSYAPRADLSSAQKEVGGLIVQSDESVISCNPYKASVGSGETALQKGADALGQQFDGTRAGRYGGRGRSGKEVLYSDTIQDQGVEFKGRGHQPSVICSQ